VKTAGIAGFSQQTRARDPKPWVLRTSARMAMQSDPIAKPAFARKTMQIFIISGKNGFFAHDGSEVEDQILFL
jgi:hypothetical protein